MKHDGHEVIFKCKTLEGHILKSLFELLHNHYKIICFEVSNTGFKLRQMDDSKLIITDIELTRENFSVYWLETPIKICVHVDHLYKIIKNCKRHDAISLIVYQEQPRMLHIDIQKDNSTCSNANLPMQEMQLDDIELPIVDNYACQINLSTKDFFKLIKDNVAISDKCRFDCLPFSIQIISDNSGMYTKKLRFGEIQADNNDVVARQTFYTFHLNKLAKFSVLSHMFSIKCHENTPMYLSIAIGHIGMLRLFMKSIEQDSSSFSNRDLNSFNTFPYEYSCLSDIQKQSQPHTTECVDTTETGEIEEEIEEIEVLVDEHGNIIEDAKTDTTNFVNEEEVEEEVEEEEEVEVEEEDEEEEEVEVEEEEEGSEYCD